jgi:hypothetical protein
MLRFAGEPMKGIRLTARCWRIFEESSVRWRTDYPGGVGDTEPLYALSPCTRFEPLDAKEMLVNRIVYIVGAIVIIVALLSFFGLR